MSGLRCARYLFVAMAPCTILHWRSPTRFSIGGLYRDRQQPLGVKLVSKTSVHFDTLTSAKNRKFRTFTQILYKTFFPKPSKQPSGASCRDISFPGSSCHWSTAGETIREGNTYSYSSSHWSNKVLLATKPLMEYGREVQVSSFSLNKSL
ncbi:hypothetical protein AMECASPLE_027528 [Ameca splendens]|uniref:Secreted protein n=1 Tax=Ameca splendens TaxID=208324 RepID=A0ABV0YS88_9TELE